MKIKDIKKGEYFNIGNTPSYPKLKLDVGYIDVRDEIRNKNNDLPFEAEIMSDEQVYKEMEKYKMTAVDTDLLKERLLEL